MHMKKTAADKCRELYEGLDREDLIDVAVSMTQHVAAAQRLISRLGDRLRMDRQAMFGRSSEQTPWLFRELEEVEKSLELFEQEAGEEGGQEIQVTYTRKAGGGRKDVDITCLPEDTPRILVDLSKDEPEELVHDGRVFVKSGTMDINQLETIPARLVVKVVRRAVYSPKDGSITDGDRAKDRIVRMANRWTDAIGATPGFLADILVRKFDDHLPLYRQSEILARDGLRLSRQRMSSWLMLYAGQLGDFWEFLKTRVYDMNLINQDETGLEVLKARTSTGNIRQDGYMFIRIGSSWDGKERRCHSLVLFEYIQGRSTQVLMEDYGRLGYDGYVMTDGLKQYGNIPDERHATCLVHAERGFKNILRQNRGCKLAKDAVLIFAEIFRTERRLRGELAEGRIDAGTFLATRRREEGAQIDRLVALCREKAGRLPQDSPLGKACAYVVKREKLLPRYLDIVECTPDNNSAERQARDLAVGRKNWLFCNTVEGAKAAAIYYSLVQTAKANGLDSRDYLELVLSTVPYDSSEAAYESLLPWNVDTREFARMREVKMQAAVDHGRKTPYCLSGLNGGQTIL